MVYFGLTESRLILTNQTQKMDAKAAMTARIQEAQEIKHQSVIKINRVLEAQIQDLLIQLETRDEDGSSRDLDFE